MLQGTTITMSQPLGPLPQQQQTNIIGQQTQLQPLTLQPQQQLQQTQTLIAQQQSANVKSAQAEFQKRVAYYKEKQQLSKEQQLELLLEQSIYLQQKIEKKFFKDIQVKQTQGKSLDQFNKVLLIDEMNANLANLFRKFGLNERNIEYQQDELLRLCQRIKADQKKQQLLFQSQIKIKDFPQQSEYLDINIQIQKNRNLYLSFKQIEKESNKRQQNQLKYLLHKTKQEYDVTKSVTNQVISFNSHNQILIDKLLKEQGLFEKLEQFVQYQNYQKKNNNVEEYEFYEKIFRIFINLQSENSQIMKLLSEQFRGIQFESQNLKENLLENSIQILETEMFKKIGVFDLSNLNQKFIDIYYDKLNKDITIRKQGQYYPSGILLILLRCGQLKLAQSLLQQFNKNYKYALFFELLEKRNVSNQDKISQLDLLCDDELFKQCYWIIFNFGEHLDCLDRIYFQLDPDFYLWLNLKTISVSDDDQNTFSLKDIHECMPNLGVRTDILILRYEKVLKELNNQDTLISKLEYLLLYFCIGNLFNNEQFEQIKKDLENNYNSILSNCFEKYPEIGCLLIALKEKDEDHIIERIQIELNKQKYNPNLLTNQKLFDIIEIISGGNIHIQELISQYYQYFFQNKLIESYKQFSENLVNLTSINQLIITQKQIINDIDNLVEEITIYLSSKQIELSNLSIELYWIVSIVFILSECQIKLKTIELQKQQNQNGQIKINNTPKQYYNLFATIQSIAISNIRMRQKYEFLLVFLELIQSNKLGQFNINKFHNQCLNFEITKITQILIQDKQIYLLTLYFWFCDQIFQINNYDSELLKNQRLQATNILSKQKYGIPHTIQLINKEINLNFQELPFMPK